MGSVRANGGYVHEGETQRALRGDAQGAHEEEMHWGA